MISKIIKERIVQDNKRFWAGDNISAFIKEGEKQQLIDELAVKFEDVTIGVPWIWLTVIFAKQVYGFVNFSKARALGLGQIQSNIPKQ